METLRILEIMMYDITIITITLLGILILVFRTSYFMSDLEDWLETIGKSLGVLILGNLIGLFVVLFGIELLMSIFKTAITKLLCIPFGIILGITLSIWAMLYFQKWFFIWVRDSYEYKGLINLIRKRSPHIIIIFMAGVALIIYMNHKSMKLQNAISKSDKVDNIEILNGGVNINSKGLINGITPLHKAIEVGDIDVVTSLINAGSNTNVYSRWARLSPLHYSIIYDRKEILNVLLNNQADIKAKTSRIIGRYSPIRLAEMQENQLMLNILTDKVAAYQGKTAFVGSLRQNKGQLPDYYTLESGTGSIAAVFAGQDFRQAFKEKLPVRIKAGIGDKNSLNYLNISWRSDSAEYKVQRQTYGKQNVNNPFGPVETFVKNSYGLYENIYDVKEYIIEIPSEIYINEVPTGNLLLNIEGWWANANLDVGTGFSTNYFTIQVDLNWMVLPDGFLVFYPEKGTDIICISDDEYYWFQNGTCRGPYDAVFSPIRYYKNSGYSGDITSTEEWRNEIDATDYKRSVSFFGKKADYYGWALKDKNGWHIITQDGLHGPLNIGEPGIFIDSDLICYSLKIGDDWYVVFNNIRLGPYDEIYIGENWTPFTFKYDKSAVEFYARLNDEMQKFSGP